MNEKLDKSKQIEQIEKWTRQAELTRSFKSNLRHTKQVDSASCLFVLLIKILQTLNHSITSSIIEEGTVLQKKKIGSYLTDLYQ